MYRIAALLIATAGLILSATAPAKAQTTPSPKLEMQKTIDDIIRVAAQYPDDAQKTTRRQKLRELINPKFNFTEMSRRSLGAEGLHHRIF
jgi:ABC-type transporter MlaC component